MAKTLRVKINQPAWGREVMASAQMQAFLGGMGRAVAAQLPGGSVEVRTSRTVRGGGRRARAIVNTTIPMSEEADTGRAQAALRAVVGNAAAPKRTRSYRARERKREERRG